MFSDLDIAQFKITLCELGFGVLRLLFIASISFIALWFQLLPIPEHWVNYWPMWSPLIVLIGSILLPSHWMIGYAWLLGLVLDCLYGNKLGTHAIGLSLISYLTYYSSLSNEIQPSERINQAIFAFLFFALYQFMIWCLQRLTHIPVSALGQRLWFPPFFTSVIWFCLIDVIRFGYDALRSERQF